MDWPHAPLHRTDDPGWYFITAGTYLKQHFLRDGNRRGTMIELMHEFAPRHGLDLQYWTVLSNHYHIIVGAEETADIPTYIRKLHSKSSHEFNESDRISGRKVWYQYRDTYLRDEKSYLARVNYIHQNAVKHGIVRVAENYRWSSARVFEELVGKAFAEQVRRLKTDKLDIPDDD